MTRRFLRSLFAAVVLWCGALGAVRAQAAEAAPDSLLDDYMRRMADSTSAYFGRTAEQPDTTGLDSLLVESLARPAGERPAARRAHRFALGPQVGFNRVDGWSLGPEVATGASRRDGRVSAKAMYSFGQKDWLGGGRYLRRWTERARDAAWKLDVWAGRSTLAFDRDDYEPVYATVRAVVAGADRQLYLRRDGVQGSLERRTASGQLTFEYRDQWESSRPTSTAWNLFASPLAVGPNGVAAVGRVREAAFMGEWRVPGVPARLEVQHWTAGPATRSDFTYRRTRAALGGDLSFTRHIAIAPQVEWGRLRGDALPQDAFFLGGTPNVRSLERNERQGTGRAFGRVDMLLMDDVLDLVRIPHPAMFPLQVGAFVGSGAVWGGEAFAGGPATRRDFPRANEWLSETGISVMYRPGLPDPELFLRLDYVIPLGPDSGREAGLVVSFQRTLNLLAPRNDY